MPVNSVFCPHCGKRSRMELSEEEPFVICLACGEKIHRDSCLELAEIATDVVCEVDESEQLLKKKRRNKVGNSKRRSKRLLIAGAPPWAWALFFYVFGVLSSGGAVVAFFLYFQSDRNAPVETAKNGSSTPANKSKTTGNPNVLSNSVNNSDLAAGKPVSVPPEMFRPVPEARTDNGWPIYVVSEEGFSLAIPPEWRQVDTSPGKFEANYTQFLEMNPQLPFLGGIQPRMSPTIKFYGMDEPGLSTGFATNVNVIHVGSSLEGTLDSVVEGIIGDLQKVPMISKPIRHERVKVGAGECELLRFRITVPMPGPNQVTAVTQYVFISSSGVHIVSMNTTTNREEHYSPIFEKIVQTFRLIRRQDRD